VGPANTKLKDGIIAILSTDSSRTASFNNPAKLWKIGGTIANKAFAVRLKASSRRVSKPDGAHRVVSSAVMALHNFVIAADKAG
jgi:hypothetical protein